VVGDLARGTARRCGDVAGNGTARLISAVTGHTGAGTTAGRRPVTRGGLQDQRHRRAVDGRAGQDARAHQPCTGGGVQPFQLEPITAGGDCAVLRMDGEIDACAAPQIRERVLDLARNGTVHIIADLRGAGFLDSAGLGALVGSRTGLRARGGSLTLVASAGRIRQTLQHPGRSHRADRPMPRGRARNSYSYGQRQSRFGS
jgi:anti-anti-sigma factor